MKAEIFKLESSADQKRLSRYIQEQYPHLPYSLLQKWLRKGEIRLNGKRVKGDEILSAGALLKLPPSARDFVAVSCTDEARTVKIPKNFESWIIYEDDSFLALNKPSGLPSQGGTGQDVSLDAVLATWADQKNLPKPRLAHRLDKDTSGILLCGLNPQAAASLAREFREGKIQKTYLALCAPPPAEPSGRIEKRLKKGRKGEELEIMQIDPAGAEAVTEYETLGTDPDTGLALIRITPLTGRTHQIRVHMASIGAPILGDLKYQGQNPVSILPQDDKSCRLRMALHARTLSFYHPTSGHTVRLHAELPPSWEMWLKTTRLEECLDKK